MSNKSRATRFSDIQSIISYCIGEATELHDELQEWLDNMPENLQSSAKADELNEVITALEEFVGNLQEAENASIDFPGRD